MNPRSPAGTTLEFRGITKSFFGVTVVDNVSLTVAPGRIVGLVGENGAGKSTLMNVLGGNQRADAGSILLGGETIAPADAAAAGRLGVTLIHQELNLFPNLTVAENLFLTGFPRMPGLPLIDRPAVARNAVDWLARVGLDVPPDALVSTLSSGECQLVEIARALGADARVIGFDEPTTSLAQPECERLFELIRELRRQGRAVIFISHNLADVLQLCDDVAVLRDGRLVASGPAAEFSSDRLVSLMVGRTISQLYPPRTTPPRAETVLEVFHVSQPGVVEDISFALHRGEVLGLAGLMGSGRSELARIIFGLDPHARGEIRCAGAALGRSPPASIARGLAFLTEDRRQDGLFLEASILDNMALLALPRHARAGSGWLDRGAIARAVGRMREAVRLTPQARDQQPVKTLSGGNQQKVVLARWLLAEPAVLILDEPTRGIDVGAKTEIYQLINEAASRGAGVLVISSELEELIGICDRILVLNRGEIGDETARADFNRERLLRAALHRRANTSPAPPDAARPARLAGSDAPRRALLLALNSAPLLLFAAAAIAFGLLSPRFFELANLGNILVQSASTAIVAVGMTFVLLTAGVDLSVGALMFVAAAVAGKMAVASAPLGFILPAMAAIGAAGGALNAAFITRFRVVPFIVTLATLYVGRGFALWLTETRAINLPVSFLDLGAARVAGVPLPIVVLGLVAAAAHLLLRHTAFGRQIYAVGHDREAARQAGIPTARILVLVYVISGLTAGIGAIVSLSQLGAVSPTFGSQKEFAAIAAAVLGGTSLFGGRGQVFPGTVLGAILIQTVENGLVIVNADPYAYPLFTSAIIFFAVLVDSIRHGVLGRLNRRRIRPAT